jgi:hypothetical protein
MFSDAASLVDIHHGAPLFIILWILCCSANPVPCANPLIAFIEINVYRAVLQVTHQNITWLTSRIVLMTGAGQVSSHREVTALSSHACLRGSINTSRACGFKKLDLKKRSKTRISQCIQT